MDKLIIDGREYSLTKLGDGKFSSTAPFVSYGGSLYATQEIGNIVNEYERQKAKLLLTTSDGVEFYEGEESRYIYGVCPKGSWEQRDVTVWNDRVREGAWLYFSTKDKRDEYVIENRPMLSFRDTLEWLDQVRLQLSSRRVDRLKKIIQNKLDGI